MHELLATIGRSSKRDEIGFARHEFLGQFGIGLLSAFLVADEIGVVTQPAGGPATHWVGSPTAATRSRRRRSAPSRARRSRSGRGAVPSSGTRRPTVVELIRLFGALLPIEVRVDGERVTDGTAPWEGPVTVPTSSGTRRTSSGSRRST